MTMIRQCGSLIWVIAILLSHTGARGQDRPMAFFPLEEIQPGMTGYGLSVFQGTEIDTFSVEILGVMNNIFYAKHNLILVRIGGPHVDNAGVIAGMSGSPVYIDGKLIGALAYSFGQMPKESIGAVTPIGQMMEIAHVATGNRHKEAIDTTNETGEAGRSIIREQSAPGLSGDRNGSGASSFLRPISVPMVFSGFDPAAVHLFEDRFRSMGLTPVLGGGGSDTDLIGKADASTLVPGSAVGAQLVRGDMSIAATGTVTYRDGNTILAFGHPFLWSGAIDVPMTRAEIISVVPDQASSTKISNVKESVGSILWDHTNGLYGELGGASRMIPMRVDFIAGDQIKDTYKFEVISSSTWTPMLVNMTVSNTVLANGQMAGERTIRLDGRVSMRGYEDIILQDLFSGGLSLPAVTTDITNVLAVVLDNPFVTPNIESIALTIQTTDDRRTAEIEGVWYDKGEVKPGEMLDLRVFLRPYRGDRIVKTISIPIPANISDQDIHIIIGAARTLTQQEARTTPQRFRPQEVGQLINLLNKRRTNNSIYIKVYQSQTGGIVKGEEMPALPPSVLFVMNSSRINGNFTPIREFVLAEREILTDYVISGQSRARFEVKR